MRPKGSSADLEQRRRHAVALLQRGVKPAVVARALKVSLVSVGRWRKAVGEGSLKALCAKPHPGRQPKLSAWQRQRLGELLLKGARHHGFATELWTLQRIAKVIERRFGVVYHPSTVWHVLQALNWSCQKPQCRARERDEQAIEHWRRYRWPHIKKGRRSRQNHPVPG